MEITCNKADWSGEEITVKVNVSKNEFKLFGYNFRLRHAGKGCMKVISDGWDYPLCKVYDIDGEFYATNGFCEHINKDMYKAVIQLLCNTI